MILARERDIAGLYFRALCVHIPSVFIHPSSLWETHFRVWASLSGLCKSHVGASSPSRPVAIFLPLDALELLNLRSLLGDLNRRAKLQCVVFMGCDSASTSSTDHEPKFRHAPLMPRILSQTPIHYYFGLQTDPAITANIVAELQVGTQPARQRQTISAQPLSSAHFFSQSYVDFRMRGASRALSDDVRHTLEAFFTTPDLPYEQCTGLIITHQRVNTDGLIAALNSDRIYAKCLPKGLYAAAEAQEVLRSWCRGDFRVLVLAGIDVPCLPCAPRNVHFVLFCTLPASPEAILHHTQCIRQQDEGLPQLLGILWASRDIATWDQAFANTAALTGKTKYEAHRIRNVHRCLTVALQVSQQCVRLSLLHSSAHLTPSLQWPSSSLDPSLCCPSCRAHGGKVTSVQTDCVDVVQQICALFKDNKIKSISLADLLYVLRGSSRINLASALQCHPISSFLKEKNFTANDRTRLVSALIIHDILEEVPRTRTPKPGATRYLSLQLSNTCDTSKPFQFYMPGYALVRTAAARDCLTARSDSLLCAESPTLPKRLNLTKLMMTKRKKKQMKKRFHRRPHR